VKKCIHWLLLLFVAAALGTGCGSSNQAEDGSKATGAAKPVSKPTTDEEVVEPDVWVTLEGRRSADDVGVLMAEEKGYFADLGLGLSVGSGVPELPRRPVTYVSRGGADLGISQLPQVVVAKRKRAPVVAVGSVLPQSTVSMIWLKKSKIRGISDLKGKTIAVPGIPYQEEFLRLILAHVGLTPGDVKVKVVGYNLVPALVKGQADAIFGGSWNIEGAVLEARGLRPVIVPPRRLGLPDYDEVVVIARSRRVARAPRTIRKYMAAVARGTQAAIEDPEAALHAIEANEVSPGFGRKGLEAELEATLPLLSRTGNLSVARATHLINWMHRQGLIRQELPASELVAGDDLLRP